MHTYCIIPDKAQSLLELLPELDMTAAEREQSSAATVCKVLVDTAAPGWEVQLTSPVPLPAGFLDRAAEHLRRRCDLASAVFVVAVTKDFAQYLAEDWPDFVANVANGNPTVRHLLSTARWQFDGNTLALETNGDLSAQILAARGLD
ncbi:MAG TPA: hypothetical protein VN521_04380, partial [Negativicutes bacterium]|nr:hypothetical protein [Negativicutes bacterium]